MKLQEFLVAQEKDDNHLEKETKRRAKQIKICLAYFDRYRNWVDYYDYPIDDIEWIDIPGNNGYKQRVDRNKINKIKRKGVSVYKKFNYDMFWKRFLQWHQSWWT